MVAPAPHDSRGVGRWLPGVGRLDRDTDPVGRVARFDGSHGHHPGGSARHGSAGDRIAGHLPDRICAQRRGGRPARPFCDGGRRRGGVGGVRLGPGHQPGPSDRHGEAHARLGFIAAERRAAIPRSGLFDHGRGAVHRSRIGPALAAGAPHRGGNCRPPSSSRRARGLAGDRHRR